ncbi:MAG TPA: hydantoinase/oxoprolinase N-terminal domain-containing protein, partial [Planctomycetota bacterium]|nr:hydantoinase/oxoprolinase N-terminal domain-containing protein [Planctomycetota bacterium]
MGGRVVVGIDTGGTFTDVVMLGGPRAGAGAGTGRVRALKVPSTPADPAEALLAGLRGILAGRAGEARVVHGTTVATNALLERRLARTALVTNRDMEDLVEIGRQARPDLYALHPRKPAPLVPRELRFGVGQRTGADGAEVARESETELDALAAALREAKVEAIAVCLLHSYRDAAAERRIAARLAELGVPVTCSGELLPEIREVERFE